MPTYEYECNACGHRVEVFQRIAETPLTTCERCDGALRKLFHPVGISFKGSGFYTTDSRKVSTNGDRKRKPDAAPAASSDAGASGKSPEKASEKAPQKTPKKSA